MSDPGMDRPPIPRSRRSILDTLGEEIIRIISPVSLCMFLVVILVSLLDTSSLSSLSASSVATMAYSESTSDSYWDKFKGALLNSLVFVAVVTAVTFLLVLLFYLNCIKCLKFYMGFSACLVLGFMGGEISLFLIKDYSFPVDCVTFSILLFNFTMVGVLAVFGFKMPIVVTQGYLVIVGMLVAFWFTLLPEWTTWVLLVAMALYDLAAVLLPGGPLRLLVELAISRDQDIPALIYEARPVVSDESGAFVQRRVWRERRDLISPPNENLNAAILNSSDSATDYNVLRPPPTSLAADGGRQEETLVHAEEGRVMESNTELTAPLIERRLNVHLEASNNITNEDMALEGIGLGSSGAIKLGLGDFIFYSVLVGRAAMYDFMTVYACYLAIIAGLGITLMLLAFYQKALPALPVSILLGVLFYFLTRFLLQVFIEECSSNLLMF